MRIILENELEEKIWPILMAAHYKWEKNYGQTLQGQMEFYLHDLYKEETEEYIAAEIERRLKSASWGIYEPGMTMDQYIKKGLEEVNEVDWDPEELEEYKNALSDEYGEHKEDYDNIKEQYNYTVRQMLTEFSFCLFNAPEKLTVEFNGEVIQPRKNS